MGSGIECTLSKFADKGKLCVVVDTLEGRDAIQRDLDRLERWGCENHMKFNKAKCKVLLMGQGNCPPEKDLGLLVDEKLSMTWLHALTAHKAKLILGCIKNSMASRSREGILCLRSALLRPPRKSCVQLWSPQHRTDLELLDQG